MRYDTADPLKVPNARRYFERLIDKGAVIEIKECRKRSLRQNGYLFVTIEYWGTQVGYSAVEAESVYKWVNRDVYFTTKKIGGIEVPYIRHTYELSKEEMSMSIDRWRNWAAANDACPVYIPSPEEKRLVELMELEVEKNRAFL